MTRTCGLILYAYLAGACQPATPTAEWANPAVPVQAAPELVAPPISPDAEPALREPSIHLWSMNPTGAALIYAPESSDDIHIDMRCEPGSRVRILAFNPVNEGRELYLASGKESETFTAKGVPGDGELLSVDQYSSEIVIDAANHVLSAFRISGELSRGDPPDVMNAKTPTEMETIEGFFADCED